MPKLPNCLPFTQYLVKSMIACYVLQKINVPFVIVVLCWQTMELHVRFSIQQVLQFVLHQIIKYQDLTPLQLLSSVSLDLSLG